MPGLIICKKIDNREIGERDINRLNQEMEEAVISSIAYNNNYTEEQEIERKIIECVAYNKIVNGNDETALHLAAKKGYPDLVKKCIRYYNINVNAQNKRGETALHLALRDDSSKKATKDSVIIKKCIKEILKGGADVSIKDVAGYTAFLIACMNANIVKDNNVEFSIIDNIARLLLKFCKIDFENLGEELIKAVECGDIDLIAILIERGADVINAKNKNGNPVLHLLVQENYTTFVRKLIKNPEVDINAKDENGDTILHWAARRSYVDLIEDIIAHPKVNVNARDEEGKTALHIAISNGNQNIAEQIITHSKFNVYVKDRYENTILHLAVKEGDVNFVKMFIKFGVNVNAQNKEGETALHLVLRGVSNKSAQDLREIKKCMKEILKADVNFVLKNKDGKTILGLAQDIIISSKQDTNEKLEAKIGIISLLLKIYDFITLDKKFQNKELINAARNGENYLIEIFITKDVNVNTRDEEDKTPLMWTVKNGNIQGTKLLLKACADVYAEDKDGNTAWDLICVRNNYSRVDPGIIMEGKTSIAELLSKFYDFKLKALPNNCCDNMIVTIMRLRVLNEEFIKAAKCSDEDIIEIFLAAGANVNARDKNDYTALMYAVKKYNLKNTKFLLQQGADVNAQNENGNTALHLALEGNGAVRSAKNLVCSEGDMGNKIQNNNDKVVMLLLNHCKINVNIKNNEGRTPLDVRTGLFDKEIIKLLVDKSKEDKSSMVEQLVNELNCIKEIVGTDICEKDTIFNIIGSEDMVKAMG